MLKWLNSLVFSFQFCVHISMCYIHGICMGPWSCVCIRQRLILASAVNLCHFLKTFYCCFNLYFSLMCMDFAFMYVCAPLVCFAHGGQKRNSYPLRLKLKGQLRATRGCQELTLGPLQEQPLLLTTEQSLTTSLLILSLDRVSHWTWGLLI